MFARVGARHRPVSLMRCDAMRCSAARYGREEGPRGRENRPWCGRAQDVGMNYADCRFKVEFSTRLVKVGTKKC